MNALRASFNLHRDPLPRNNFQMEVVLRPLPEGQLGKVRLTVCVNDRGANAITVSCGTRGGSNLEKKIAEEVRSGGGGERRVKTCPISSIPERCALEYHQNPWILPHSHFCRRHWKKSFDA